MINIKVKNDKVVFINLTEMKSYDGKEENLKGGGSFVEENGFGFELFNFKNDQGKCYGYTPPNAKINLKRISSEISSDLLGKYIDDVFVVFTCSRANKGRFICGFYNNARVYASKVADNKISRKILSNDGSELFAEYNIICDAKDAVLFDIDDRVILLPQSKRNEGVGCGQNAIWYADKSNRQNLKNDLINKLQEYIYGNLHEDEIKYEIHDESKTYITTTKQIVRSIKAREECIKLKGCKCNICGFDFEKTYGENGKRYIEVHHIIPVGKLSGSENYNGTDPEKDLIPLCSNCHSMIHRRKIPYHPDDIREMLQKNN